MVPELSIARVFQRELDALPLPPEDAWVPNARPARAPALAMAIGAVAIAAILIVTVYGVRASQDPAAVGAGAVSPTPPSSACAGSDVHRPCLGPLPVIYRSPVLGYNIVIPGGFHRVVNDAPPPRTSSGLVYRERFTARPADEDRASLASFGALPPWDFVVEVYDRAVVTASERAHLDGCTAGCVTTQTTIQKEPALSATWTDGGVVMHGYYMDRGDRVLVLKYAVGPETSRPAGVNESDLLRIVETIGLV